MATDQTTANAPAGTEGTSDTDEATERRPYIVVLMSAEMKDAVKKFADEHDTNPTALARKLLAEHVGYALENEPPTTRRSTYTSDEERHAAHKVASKKSGLIRKALFLVHVGQRDKKPELLAAANRAVMDLADTTKKLSAADLEALDAELEAAKKAKPAS